MSNLAKIFGFFGVIFLWNRLSVNKKFAVKTHVLAGKNGWKIGKIWSKFTRCVI